MGVYHDTKAKTEEAKVDSSVVAASCGGFGISEAFLLFLILILLIVGFSFL